jgi:adenylosuccinate synthase
MRTPVDILFGGQYGSEGKGVIAAYLSSDYDVHVRVGAPNAGHSFIGPDRCIWKMQTVPCGWINPQALLVIGRGGLIDPELLRREVEAIADLDSTIYSRLMIDAKCGVLDKCFHEQEGGIHGEMHKRIGSTGEGVGPAREARISRDPERFRLYQDLADDDDPWFAQFEVRDTPSLIARMRKAGNRVLLEGAQGQGLSLIHGPWPYCTSTDPGPAQFAADVGIPPREIGRIIACFRTFPIRVAGNSGPLPGETTWEIMSERLGRPTSEQTTITKKTRRIAFWDDDIAEQCRTLHGPTDIALTFVDYLNPADEGVDNYGQLSQETRDFIARVERVMEAPVTLIGTGGPKLRVFRRQ